VEPLAFVEVLGRHNEVLARHPVARWPAHVGRGYDGDVILDDPYVAPRHLRIEPFADGRFTVTDLQSANGLSLAPSRARLTGAQVGPEDVVRIGQTRIRVRPASYSVPPELVLRAPSAHRRPLGFVASAAILLALVIWNTWVTTLGRDDKFQFVYPAIGVLVAVGAWIAVWALVGRAVGGRDNFAAHGFVACAGLLAIFAADVVADYLSFAVDASWLEYGGFVAAVVVFAYMIYRHLRLNSRARPRSLAVISAVTSLAIAGAFAGMQLASESPREGRMRYAQTIKAPVFLWASGDATTAFLASADKLKDKADALSRAER